jgi:hypothetical protein
MLPEEATPTHFVVHRNRSSVPPRSETESFSTLFNAFTEQMAIRMDEVAASILQKSEDQSTKKSQRRRSHQINQEVGPDC